MPSPGYLLALSFFILNLLFIRLLQILPISNPTRPQPRKRGSPTRLLIVLGSGGHTAEMFSLLRDLDPLSYTHRSYVISSGDDFSARKAIEFEQMLEERLKARGPSKPGPLPTSPATDSATSNSIELQHEAKSTPVSNGTPLPTSPQHQEVSPPQPYDISTVPRARRIHQSLLTSPFSCLHCLVACIRVLHSPSPSRFITHQRSYPDLLLLNGPATSTILLLASLLLRFLALPGTSGKMRSIYVESWARVKGLSLSGKVLVGLGACERVLVQWEGLAGVGGRGEFRGCLVG
ncbi:UDP-N-acetylglucosamine transferase subunit [Lignoscripta atroalba]|nr:UDP-N-acetylglucosamine transferase subunit [Lignoscripta atroalba]